MVKHDFDIGEKKLTLYAAAEANRPLVVIHTFDGDGGNIWAKIQALGQDFQGKAAANDFNLLVVCIPDWDHAMTPWSASPLSKKTLLLREVPISTLNGYEKTFCQRHRI